jgi:hypothetical protein
MPTLPSGLIDQAKRYIPPVKFRPGMVRDDMAALWELVDAHGRILFPDKWDATEVHARDRIGEPMRPISVPNAHPTLTIRGYGPEYEGAARHFAFWGSAGQRVFETEEQALEAYNADHPILVAAIAAERAARERYLAARKLARTSLARGEIVASLLLETTGHKEPVPRDFWDSERGSECFESLGNTAKIFPPGAIVGMSHSEMTGRCFVWRADLPKAPGSCDGTEATTEQLSVAKAAGGAPAKYDWDRFIAALVEMADLNGFQSGTFAEALRWAEAWWSENHANPPGDSTIRSRLERYAPHLARRGTRPAKAKKTADSNNPGR